MLIPASTDIAIFHEIIYPNASIYFIKGRVKFKGFNSFGKYVTNKCGQSGSMLVVFDPKEDVTKNIQCINLEQRYKN